MERNIVVLGLGRSLRRATCGGGEYKYKVAYDEAERLLAYSNDRTPEGSAL